MPEKIEEIQQKINEIGIKIEAPESFLDLRFNLNGEKKPRITIKNDRFFIYTPSKKNYIKSKIKTESIDEILYAITKDIAMKMAVEYGYQGMVTGIDRRMIVFAKYINILEKTTSDWAEKAKKEIEDELIKNPYKNDYFYTDNIFLALFLKAKIFLRKLSRNIK